MTMNFYYDLQKYEADNELHEFVCDLTQISGGQ